MGFEGSITQPHVDNVSLYFLFSNICAGNEMNQGSNKGKNQPQFPECWQALWKAVYVQWAPSDLNEVFIRSYISCSAIQIWWYAIRIKTRDIAIWRCLAVWWGLCYQASGLHAWKSESRDSFRFFSVQWCFV